MTQDEIIEMWKNSGDLEILGMPYNKIETFAKLVAQHEREACAKIGDDHPSWSSRMYSATIRARGQA
jgi:hypothetical protein